MPNMKKNSIDNLIFPRMNQNRIDDTIWNKAILMRIEIKNIRALEIYSHNLMILEIN